MAVVTPYEGVDYQQLSAYRPYQLPINDIFKGVAAQSQYWEEGAYRVKNVYETALNLSLTKDENKEIRDKFVKDSEELLAKLSTMNLADPSVQRTGVNIYKPLFQDRGIVSDHAATQYINTLNAEIEGYKKSDKGKYYNAFNHQYALLGVKEFKDSKDRNAGEEYLKVAKRYEPYHDYTEEYKKVKDLCPADEENRTFPYYPGGAMSGYLKSIELRERTVSKAYNCLLSNLSAASMRQLQIEGTVNYKMMPIEDFGKEINTIYEDEIKQYQKKREEISAELLKIRGDSKLTKEQKKEKYLQYTNERDKITEEISATQNKKDKLDNGDYSELEENFEGYAGNLYTQKKLYKEAVSLAFREYTERFEGDPVQLNKIKFEQDKWLQNAGFNHEVDMFNMRARKEWEFKQMDQQFQLSLERMKLFFGPQNTLNQKMFDIDPKTGQIVPRQLNENDYLRFNEFKEGKEKEGDEVYNELQKKIANANLQLAENKEATYNRLITLAETNSEFRENLLKTFGKTDLAEFKQKISVNDLLGSKYFGDISTVQGGRNSITGLDGILDSYEVTNSTISAGLVADQAKIDIQDREVYSRLGVTNMQDYINKVIKTNESFTFDGIKFTEQDVAQLLLGKTINKDGKIVQFTDVESGNLDRLDYKMFINGEDAHIEKLYDYQVDKHTVFTEGIRFNGFVGKVAGKFNGGLSKMLEVRNDVYRMSNFDESPRFISINDSDHVIAQKIQSAFLNTDNKPDKTISIAGFDGSGTIAVSIPGKQTLETVRSKIKNLGIGSGDIIQLNEEGTLFQVDGTNYGVMDQPINDPLIRNIATGITNITKTYAFDNAKVGQLVTQLKVPVFSNGSRMDGYINIIKEGESNARFTLTTPSFADDPLIESRSALGFMNSYTEIHQNISDEYINELNRFFPQGLNFKLPEYLNDLIQKDLKNTFENRRLRNRKR
jgi:hypothetical protein